MDAHRWRQVTELFHAASERPADERSGFLRAACAGDDALRREVELLLASDDNTEEMPWHAFDDIALREIGDKTGPTLEPGATLGNYRIERLLGRGGMGAVFLAFDTVLRRHVALKAIDEHAADEDGTRPRLLREARNAAALNHPNICTIHEVGEAEGVAFIAMEYVEGRTLRDRIDEGEVPLEDALRYAVQAADALAYAHDHGVVHRDFKAANVIVTLDGRLKVVDFGLARRADAAMTNATTMPSLVSAGVAAGTPYAMAPEQVRGEAADARTDVWSLGVLLYEMLSGAQPFAGTTLPELFSSILRDTPAPLAARTPPALASVIGRCLEKHPSRRYEDAGQLRAILADTQATLGPHPRRRWPSSRTQGLTAAGLLALAFVLIEYSLPSELRITRTASVPAASLANHANAGGPRTRRSVALLGFSNVSQRVDVAYISTALDQGLGSELGAGDSLRVVSGEEISRLKQDLHVVPGETLAQDTLRKIRDGLGVDVIVTGSYTAVGTPAGNQVRVDLRVQDTGSGQIVGAVSSTGSETGLLALISDSGASVRRTLGLTSVEPQRIATTSLPTTLDARRLYAEGLDALHAFDAKSARDLFERSIAQEPDFALAHVGLANAWSVLGYDSQAVREAAAAADLAGSLRKEDQTWIQALYREYARQWDRAIASYQSLVNDYPDQPEYALKLADARTSAGLPKEALMTLASLKKSVPGAREDPRVYLAEASAAEALGDSKTEESAARAAIASAQRQGARLLVARSSIPLARALQLLGNVPAATETNETARRLFEEAGDRRGVARALIQLGTLSRETGDLKKAEQSLSTALAISREIGNKRQTSQSLNELANVYFHLRRFSAAADLYDQAVTVSRELGDQGGEARALGNLASVHYEQGDVAEAQRLDEQALKIKRAIGDQRSISFSLINIAETAADLGKLDAAQQMYEESRAIDEKLNAKSALAYSLSGLATVAFRRDQLGIAQELTEKALQLRMDTHDAEGVLDAEITLASIALERNDIATASTLVQQITAKINEGAPEQVARAAALRSALLVRQGRASEARSVLSAVTQGSSEGYSAATGVALELEDARLLAVLGDRMAAARKTRAVAARERMRGLLAFQLQAELVAGEIRVADREAIKALAGRARAAKFNLIARKAEMLLAVPRES